MTIITSKKQLIKHCEDSIVPVMCWHDRDSPAAQSQVGECWAKIKAGCAYQQRLDEDNRTIWLDVFTPTFDDFENGTQEESEQYETYYLPTIDRLKQAKGGDWY
jgi:hypothetical protein